MSNKNKVSKPIVPKVEVNKEQNNIDVSIICIIYIIYIVYCLKSFIMCAAYVGLGLFVILLVVVVANYILPEKYVWLRGKRLENIENFIMPNVEMICGLYRDHLQKRF